MSEDDGIKAKAEAFSKIAGPILCLYKESFKSLEEYIKEYELKTKMKKYLINANIHPEMAEKLQLDEGVHYYGSNKVSLWTETDIPNWKMGVTYSFYKTFNFLDKRTFDNIADKLFEAGIAYLGVEANLMSYTTPDSSNESMVSSSHFIVTGLVKSSPAHPNRMKIPDNHPLRQYKLNFPSDKIISSNKWMSKDHEEHAVVIYGENDSDTITMRYSGALYNDKNETVSFLRVQSIVGRFKCRNVEDGIADDYSICYKVDPHYPLNPFSRREVISCTMQRCDGHGQLNFFVNFHKKSYTTIIAEFSAILDGRPATMKGMIEFDFPSGRFKDDVEILTHDESSKSIEVRRVSMLIEEGSLLRCALKDLAFSGFNNKEVMETKVMDFVSWIVKQKKA